MQVTNSRELVITLFNNAASILLDFRGACVSCAMRCVFGVSSETRAPLNVLQEWLKCAPLEMLKHHVTEIGPDSGNSIYALKTSRRD